MARRTSASRRSTRGVFRTPSGVYWRPRRTRTLGASALTIVPTGIDSAEAFGTLTIGLTIAPTGIPTGETIGSPVVMGIAPTGIPSGETIGAPVIVPGPVTITCTGIDSGEAFGSIELTVTIDPTRQTRAVRRRTRVRYELFCVARIPAVGGAPMLQVVDAIDWSKLSWSSTLSKTQGMSASVELSSLSDIAAQRLLQPDTLPVELWLERDGARVFAGPLRTWRATGTTVELVADGLLGYLDGMIVTTDLRFDQIDQHMIAKALVDQWQAYWQYTNLGIDTSAVTASGTLRDRSYPRTEGHIIGRRIQELGAVDGGFDVEVDPATRQLRMWTPTKGVDRSTGSDAVVFDSRNVSALDVAVSVAPDDMATYAFGTGSSSGTDSTLWAAWFDSSAAAAYGGLGRISSWSDVSVQATLDDHTLASLQAHKRALVVPGPKIRVSDDADLSAWDVGDTVRLEMPGKLGMSGGWRVRKRTVTVEATGAETVDIEFV